MNKTTEAVLKQLERESRSLPPDVRESFLEEVRSHLDQDIQARMELGLGEETARAEAIAAFGNPTTVSRRLVKAHDSQLVDGPLLYALIAVSLFGATLVIWEGASRIATFGVAIASMAVIIAAARRRVFPWRTFLAAHPIAAVALAIALSWTYAPDGSLTNLGTSYSIAKQQAQWHLTAVEQAELSLTYRRVPSIGFGGSWEPVALEMAAELVDPLGSAIKRQAREERDAAIERRHNLFLRDSNLAAATRLLALKHEDWWKGVPLHLIAAQGAALSALLSLMALAYVAFWLRRISRYVESVRGRRGTPV